MATSGPTGHLVVDLVSAPVSEISLDRSADLIGDVDDEKQCMLLVMRVLSIVPLNSKVSSTLPRKTLKGLLPECHFFPHNIFSRRIN